MTLHLVPRPLRYVMAVAEHGSVQAASRELGIAASAIDRHIHALEEAGQTPLFERQPRGMRLTAAGEAVVVLARRWQVDADRLDENLASMRGQEHGTVRVAAMDSLVNGLLPDLVAWTRQNHPRIHLAVDIVTPAEAAVSLDGGTVDLVIAFNLPKLRHQHGLWTGQLPFGCAMSVDHPLAARSDLTLADLGPHQTVAQSSILPIRQKLDRTHSWFFSDNAPVLSTNSLQLLKKSLIHTELVMITSELDVLPELERGALVFVPLRERSLRPQSVSVAIDSRRTLLRAARVVSEYAATEMERRLLCTRSHQASRMKSDGPEVAALTRSPKAPRD